MGLRERASGGARPDYTIEVCGEEDFLWAGAGLMNDFRVCHCVGPLHRGYKSRRFVTRVCLCGRTLATWPAECKLNRCRAVRQTAREVASCECGRA